MACRFLPGTPELVEFTNSTPGVKKIYDHIKSVADSICFRRETLTHESSNLTREHIINELGRIRGNKNSFGFLYYMPCIVGDARTKRPVALMLARRGSRAEGYVVSLVCRMEHAERGLGKKLFDNLIARAKLEGVRTVVVEAVFGATRFYQSLGFKSCEGEKATFTESSEDDTLFGMVLDVEAYPTLTGGGDAATSSSCPTGLAVRILLPNSPDMPKVAEFLDKHHDWMPKDPNNRMLTIWHGNTLRACMVLEDDVTVFGKKFHVYCTHFDDEATGQHLLTALEALCARENVRRVWIWSEHDYAQDLVAKSGFRLFADKSNFRTNMQAYERMYPKMSIMTHDSQ